MQITDSDQYKTASQLNNPASATISEEPIPDTSRKDEEKSKPRCPHLFGFSKFIPPPLLCRHPPPAVGRDDDINKLREILDDVLVKTGNHTSVENKGDRILMGPDNKIGTNLITLVEQGGRYQNFTPEFPLLHLRKSKINTLFSAYQEAGLLHILMYMKDDDTKEWAKLISAHHIDLAAKNVRRLALGFRLAFTIRFMQSMPTADSNNFLLDMQRESPQNIAEKYHETFKTFMQDGSTANCTFALHVDMMKHCEEVSAVALSERLGGSDGYNLLLAAVKSSLLFAYLNGASSYAPYCTKLLAEHYSAGHFHRKMKETLYTTPIGNSNVNFACDTKREIDHQDALKGFRSGSNLSAVTCRMSLIDPFNEIHSQRQKHRDEKQTYTQYHQNDSLGLYITDVDLKHIYRTCSLILRRGGISTEPNDIPYNVYTKENKALSASILDIHTEQVGHYLVERFVAREKMFNCTKEDEPKVTDVVGPRALVSKAGRTKGKTLKRSKEKPINVLKSDREANEITRKKNLKKQFKQSECLSSEMNTCQALVKPDCSKPKVQKSLGIRKALHNLLLNVSQTTNSNDIIHLINLDREEIPKNISENLKAITLEFAGVKFKTKAITGTEYLKFVENNILRKCIKQMPKLNMIAVCEEKYRFTPDTFKAATREQRKRSIKVSIAHLKTAGEILSSETLTKDAIVTTTEGKSLISTYLGANASILKIESDVAVDIDSELYVEGCSCQAESHCKCNLFTRPIRCKFNKTDGKPNISILQDIKQRKGEAEMAQVDWLFNYISDLDENDVVASIVTSGDIDAVTIHLFAISLKWPRLENGKYRNPVYIVLQKPSRKCDIYNITAILECLENNYKDPLVGVKIAVYLCMGGNDFIPKFHQISHEKVLMQGLSLDFINSLVIVDKVSQNVSVQVDVYVEFVKHLYCSKRMDPKATSFQTVREFTMKKKQTGKCDPLVFDVRNAQLWMPPETAIRRVAELLILQVEYLITAGEAGALLPNFLGRNCLRKRTTGEIEYDFGPESKIQTEELAQLMIEKRKPEKTPQKGKRRKKQMTSTPCGRKKLLEEKLDS